MATLKSNGYKVLISRKIYGPLSTFLAKQNYSSYFIVCDENTLQECLPVLISNCEELANAHVLEIESGEASKSLDFAAHIWETLIENKADKNSLIINLGGGVVSDLSSFTASVYKRGVDFINIPTSLLAMADASVGGKTGIDFGNIKNSIGTFSQPKAVFINPDFLNTLPQRHFKNGLAEIYKMALISDKNFWQSLQRDLIPEVMIKKCIELKNTIVLKDPFDKGIRNILNFGHTIGHAIETLLLGTDEELFHGEAIVIGMIIESHISFQKKLIQKKELTEIVSVFKNVFPFHSIEKCSHENLFRLMSNDKKTSANKFRFSLLTKIGACNFHESVTESQVKKAIDYYSALVK